jgi:hypothetical protein
MSPQPHTRRRTTTAAIVAVGLVTPALAALTALPARADDCRLPGDDLFCNPISTRPGSSGGSGGTGGGSSGPVLPPPPEGLTADEAIGTVPVDGPPPAPAAPSTSQLVEQAMASRGFPVPTVHTAPDGKTYVRVRTSLWVDGFDVVRTEPVSAGDQTVQATAEPVSVTWNLGEKQLVCKNAGSKNGDDCNYTYKRSSTGQPGGKYQITATVTWHATWTCEGAECDSPGGDLGDQTSTSLPTPLVVGEIQTNTGQ